MKNIIQNKSLLIELIKKDIKIRYRRLSLGFFWTFLSPFLMVVIFYVIFHLFLQVKIVEAPFLAYLMSAVFTWRFFQDSCMGATTCLLDNKNLLKEAPFPHYFIPLSIVLSNMIIFFPSLILVVLCAWISTGALPIFLWILPFVVIIHLFITAALCVILSIIYVYWRDLKYALESLLTFLFYLTPFFYSLTLVKDSSSPVLFRLYLCNPLVEILNGYRIALFPNFKLALENSAGWGMIIGIPISTMIILWVIALGLYRKNKRHINDMLSY